MPLKFLLTVGTWRDGKYAYVTNFYTRRIGATFATPYFVIDTEDALKTFHAISAHGYVYAVIPGDAPNALFAVKRLLGVEQDKPTLALNIHFQSFDWLGGPVSPVLSQAVYLHDVKLLSLKPTVPGYLANPDGSRVADTDITAGFKGMVGPVQKIDGSTF